MTSKYELAISTGYVPEWGLVEAIRELFQNALDNEIINPENKMEWHYIPEEQKLLISNRTSVLEADTLLLGSGTKHDDNRTIGKHGEGYKIAFMVLLRNDKRIKVYNYGKRETWEVRLVKSKRYNGQLLTTVFVEKEAFWAKVPNNNLTIEISGITTDEYVHIVNRNLHLKSGTISKFKMPGRGDIILNEEERGNIYVKGLYVTSIKGLQYGYDFEPSVLGLDRDRKLVDSFNVSWEASILWQNAADNSEELKDIAVKLIKDEALDVAYAHKVTYTPYSMYNAVAEDFFNEYGDTAIPVTSNSEYETVEASGCGKPIFVKESMAKMIKESSRASKINPSVYVSIKEQLFNLLDKVEDKLTDDELNSFRELINKVKN